MERVAVSGRTVPTARGWGLRSCLSEADVPCGPIYTMDQVFSDPQALHSRIATPIVHPRRGETRLVDQVVRLTRTPASIASALNERVAATTGRYDPAEDARAYRTGQASDDLREGIAASTEKRNPVRGPMRAEG